MWDGTYDHDPYREKTALATVLYSCRCNAGDEAVAGWIAGIPRRYARILRHPRQHRTSAARVDLDSALAFLGNVDESWEEIGADGDHMVFGSGEQEELCAEFGPSVPKVFAGLRKSLKAADRCPLVDASQLAYAGEFRSFFPAFSNKVVQWLFHVRDKHDQETVAKRLVNEALSPHGLVKDPVPVESRLVCAIGEYKEMVATTRDPSGYELGLPVGGAPRMGWLPWFAVVADAIAARLQGIRAVRPDEGPRVSTPVWPPVAAPGLDDRLYGNAALFYEAFEGRPISDTPDWRAADVVRRFKRACDSLRFQHEIAPVAAHLKALIAGAAYDPRLVREVLGPVEVFRGVEPLDALVDLLPELLDDRYPPRAHPSFAELPLNGWELRFRFPLLARFGGSRPDAGGGYRLSVLTKSLKPWRVGLPPVIGEIGELLALLPSDEDLDRAMAHLGATGTGWRPVLDTIADELTARIWAGEDEPG
ncbi:hypothetical protein GCM10009727_54810 [Actinomadura napierensis]|uniref:DUF3800 domain-containing protein n=2 Tax=Actinomadura napierensis TaxID=267854 RepID=A0ABP5LSJ8_9ACTN